VAGSGTEYPKSEKLIPHEQCLLQNWDATSYNSFLMLKAKRNLLLCRLVVVEKRGGYASSLIENLIPRYRAV